MSNSAAQKSTTSKKDHLWVKLVGPLLDADDPFWFPNALGNLPRSAPHERAVVDHLYELERCGATIFVYDPILADGGRMTREAQEYIYRNGLNAWVVSESAPPAGVEVMTEWKTQSTPPSTADEKLTTISEQSSEKTG